MADMENESVQNEGIPMNNNEAESCTLRLMTFNVRNLHGDDGTVNSWNNRKDITVRAIKGFDPDIIGMQEAYRLQIHYFLQAMPHYDSVGVSRFGDERDEYANILSEG